MKALTDSLITVQQRERSAMGAARRTDGRMDGGGEFVLSLSIRAVGTTQCVYTLKTAGQMAQAIKCTDKMETNNR